MAKTNRYCYDCGADATVIIADGKADPETGYVDERGYCDEHYRTGFSDAVDEIVERREESPYFAFAVGLARTLGAR